MRLKWIILPKKFKDEDLPLKRFAKDKASLSPFTGYVQKGLNDYKSTLKHSCVNVRAKHLHELFTNELKRYEIDKQHVSRLEDRIAAIMEERFKSDKDEKETLMKQKREIERRLETLEEKYISGKIEKDLFDKYSKRFKKTLEEIHEKTDNPVYSSSNF